MAYSWQIRDAIRGPLATYTELPTDSLTGMDIDNILLIRLHFGQKDKLMVIQSSVGGFS